MSEHVRTEIDRDGILTVTFDRPERRNAFNTAMYGAATEAVRRAGGDEAVRVLVFRGEGGNFTGGHDLDDFPKLSAGPKTPPVVVFLTTLHDLDKPVVAAVDGAAFGLGTTILFCCDLVYATERARFRLPFVSLGLSPAGGTSFLLPRLVGSHRAAELVLLAEPFDAATACRLGVINAVYSTSEQLEEAVAERAKQLARLPTTSLQYAKRLMRAEERDRLQDAIINEAALFEDRLHAPALGEALSAFAERRRADFRGID